jgi:predicted nuclease of predicted toxin-antitoxin system
VRVKLDENLGRRAVEAFGAAGHDVATVHEQKLTSATDQQVFDACVSEGRLLVSLDIDFANPLRFDSRQSAGVAVLRVHSEPTRNELDEVVQTLLEALEHADIVSHLWVVRGQRVREYTPTAIEGNAAPDG